MRGLFALQTISRRQRPRRRRLSPVHVTRARRISRRSTAHWKTTRQMAASQACARLSGSCSQRQLRYVRYLRRLPGVSDQRTSGRTRYWRASRTTRSTSFRRRTKVVRALHPDGDRPRRLVLDPTCGSGTTAYVAEQWGRRWITIDTSRVALALARARIMGARYPYYLLADSREGQRKEAEVTRTAPSSTSRRTATSATASSTSACRTSR